jgi:hypothetical protein
MGGLSNPGLPLQPYTVATLPAAPVAGTMGYVTNALNPTFNSIVAGGGAVVIAVMFDGTNWRVL